MDTSRIAKGQQELEKQGDGRVVNKPGVYYHPQADRFVETAKLVPGYIQADAFVQLGYRLATSEELVRYTAQVEANKKKFEEQQKLKEATKK